MNRIQKIFLAFLIYASTLVLMPQAVIYLIIAVIGFTFWLFKMQRLGVGKSDLLYILFIGISFLIYFIGKPFATSASSKSLNDLIPYSIFIIATINFSKFLNKEIIRIIFYIILFETIIGILQYLMGVRYFIEPITSNSQELGDSDYLYYNKVYGLSTVTSIFALKIFIGILLTHYLCFKGKKRSLFYTILMFGLIVTFNRTAIVASIIFVLIIIFTQIKQGNQKLKILTLFGSIISLIFIYNYFDVIENQFFRGREVDLSGRDKVFPYYIDFIANYPFFGNYFTKLWVEITSGRIYHAHSSYLQTLSNMGLPIGIAIFTYIFSKISKLNYMFIIPMLIYSAFQYGILWGVSFMDIIFFYILFVSHKIRPEERGYFGTITKH